MNTNFEILPFPAALLESADVAAEAGVQDERFSRGMGRAARPTAPRGRSGGKGAASKVYAPGRAGGVKWPHRRPHYWPHGWLGGYGFWPAGLAVYEPDWLALADAPPGQDADGGRDNGDGDDGSDGNGFGDSGENGFGG